ncbi:MAG: HlyC/CorC family transporter [Chloroflexi bacterium]|nr:HlyC/CorC family transporter [Chloroflexota bacterium]
METVIGIVAVLALVFMNGFFVAAEFSFVGARRTRIAQLAQEGSAGARAAQSALAHLDRYIAATQLGITLASLGLGWVGEPAIAHIFEPIFESVMSPETAETVGRSISIAIAFSIVTTLHIVLGELAPKSIALQRPEDVSIIVARPTILFHNIFRPVILIMNGIGNAVVRLLGFEPASEHNSVHSAEELEMLVHSSREAGLLQENEEDLLRRVFDFSDTAVESIMHPRLDVDAFNVKMPLQKVLHQIGDLHHSRFPVYRDNIDNVIGLLTVKDLFNLLVHQPDLLAPDAPPFDMTPLLRTPIYVPMTLSVDKVLEQMRRKKMHLAIVIDEYGGIAGLVTMEDILELLVGDVEDEFDVAPPSEPGDDDPNVMSGLVSIDDVIERYGNPGDEVESATIGGYVAERLERIPVQGDTLRFADYEVRVEAMDGRRVARVRFTPITKPASPGDAGDTPESSG